MSAAELIALAEECENNCFGSAKLALVNARRNHIPQMQLARKAAAEWATIAASLRAQAKDQTHD